MLLKKDCHMENVSILPSSQKMETVRFSKMVNKFVHDHGAPHPRTRYYGKQVCYDVVSSI